MSKNNNNICKELFHPFHYDPGVSQSGRISEYLLNDAIKIDGRTLADLLDFFLQLSRHVNYYDSQLNIKNWQPFFKNSIPFTLAGIIKYEASVVKEKLDLYKSLFMKSPSPSGLQLNIYYFYYSTIYRINDWYLKLKDTELTITNDIENAIKGILSKSLAEFIKYANYASKQYYIKRLNFTPILENPIWGITTQTTPDSLPNDDSDENKCVNIIKLFTSINELYTSFIEVAVKLSVQAEKDLEPSLYPWLYQIQINEDNENNPEYQHTPHLGLLFTFLSMFRKLQGDLNGFTKKHLDFYYKNVLQILPKDATPDKVHILFEIQKNLKSYLIKKGIEVKDGKDNNKTDILFSLNNEILVNKTRIDQKRTLYLNNQDINNTKIIEGVYIATNPEMADGVDKEFQDDIKNWPTLGAKLSKYTDPVSKKIKLYQNARIGFIMASPVLLLNEGIRTIDISIYYEPGNICDNLEYNFSKLQITDFLNKISNGVYIIKRDIIKQLEKNEKNENCIQLKNKLEELFNINKRCLSIVMPKDEFEGYGCLDIPSEYVNLEKPFKILFTGKEGWIEPSSFNITEVSDNSSGKFLKIRCTLESDKPPVVFFDKKIHDENLDIRFPAVKIEINDSAKIGIIEESKKETCCLKKEESGNCAVSLYNLLKNIKIKDNSKIDVTVCGVKNLIVQNDENLQDVNKPILPFGTRPKVGKNWFVDGGANFYIGSKEIFQKNWQTIWLNTTWKDKPKNFSSHYEFYNNNKLDIFEDNSLIITDNSFRFAISILEDAKWKKAKDVLIKDQQPNLFYLFISHNCEKKKEICIKENGDFDESSFCHRIDRIYDKTGLKNSFLPESEYHAKSMTNDKLIPLNIESRNGFIKLTLAGVSFQHDRYTFVLARSMMELSGLVDPTKIDGIIKQLKQARNLLKNANKKVSDIIKKINDLEKITKDIITIDIVKIRKEIEDAQDDISSRPNEANDHLNQALIYLDYLENFTIGNSGQFSSVLKDISDIRNLIEYNPDASTTKPTIPEDDILNESKLDEWGLKYILENLFDDSGEVSSKIGNVLKSLNADNEEVEVGIPKEPYTPTIKELSIDYQAVAESDDIDFIHLYPYKDTYKVVDIQADNPPSLVPVYCDEGTLFLGLKELIPGSNINILFQMAEATADTESEQAELKWHYLYNNEWLELRKEFEILDDATNGLTTSGIIKFAIPENITDNNTIMPGGLFWIKASVANNSQTICETTGIHTQAILTTFTNQENNDKLRLSKPVDKESVSRLNIADANITKVIQPYESFGGRIPESEGHFYIRVSEQLRHKGRSIQKWDYERLCLEAFPQIFKAKCINHSFGLDANKYFNDFPFAPGYIILAVIPDLNQLKAGNTLEPEVPVSILIKVQDYLKNKTSPFVRLRVMNPRYEKVNIILEASLIPGKDENYYTEKMRTDLIEFLAPWTVGMYDKLRFGQSIYYSDIIKFLKKKDYLEHILKLELYHENEQISHTVISPYSPRSILTAGEIKIDIKPEESKKMG